ncbi:MAG: aminotransferase class I/II-fold pyridoxal phosphate-dependent enzyme, partial [Azospirillum sp.]|nr:aminotransferase class I/II-fold pyridoxal phosphate-dependent enzyme [Azospirillum sp.]
MGEALAGAPKPVQLHEPDLDDSDVAAVAACVRSGWVSSAGPQIGEFESAIAARVGLPHAVAVASGTAALQLALTVAGVVPGDEVLVPSITFVATANSVAHCGAVPHFLDCEPETLGIDPERLRAWLGGIAVADGSALRN